VQSPEEIREKVVAKLDERSWHKDQSADSREHDEKCKLLALGQNEEVVTEAPVIDRCCQVPRIRGSIDCSSPYVENEMTIVCEEERMLDGVGRNDPEDDEYCQHRPEKSPWCPTVNSGECHQIPRSKNKR